MQGSKATPEIGGPDRELRVASAMHWVYPARPYGTLLSPASSGQMWWVRVSAKWGYLMDPHLFRGVYQFLLEYQPINHLPSPTAPDSQQQTGRLGSICRGWQESKLGHWSQDCVLA